MDGVQQLKAIRIQSKILRQHFICHNAETAELHYSYWWSLTDTYLIYLSDYLLAVSASAQHVATLSKFVAYFCALRRCKPMRQLYVSGSCTAKPHRPIKSTQHVRLRLSPPWKFTHGWQTTTCKARIKEEQKKIVISRSSNDKMRKALSALARTVQEARKQVLCVHWKRSNKPQRGATHQGTAKADSQPAS